MRLVLGIQAGTFVILGAMLYRAGDWRLATAQLLLAIITILIYSKP